MGPDGQKEPWTNPEAKNNLAHEAGPPNSATNQFLNDFNLNQV